MRITLDTNILLRLLTHDDAAQAEIAQKAVSEAYQICIPTPVFCELVWALLRLYRYSKNDVLAAVRTLTEVDNLLYAENEVAAGLEQLEQGGDFADGVNEYAGRMLGGHQFVTFDKKAVTILKKRGRSVRLLSK